MRRLRLTIRTTTGTLPVVVAASVLALDGCGQSERASSGLDETGGTTTSIAGGSSGSGGLASGRGGSAGAAGTTGTGGIIVMGGSGGSIDPGSGGSAGSVNGGSGGNCSTSCSEVEVGLPDEGVPAKPGEICAATLEPVVSNRAALVRFEHYDLNGTFTGRIVIGDELKDAVVSAPVLDVLDATSESFRNLTFSNLTSDSGEFTFTAHAENLALAPEARVTLRATLEVACAGDVTRIVHAVTEIYFCDVYSGLRWASSGEACCVCRVIAEMAPSPIVPGEVSDDLPLAQALRLRIVELARVSNTVILLAEHDGGEGFDYEWLASVGEVEKLAPDVVRWTLAEGMSDPLIQAAVSAPAAAAVASFAFNDRAA